MTTPIFIRNDDVVSVTPAFLRLHNFFKGKGLPLAHAVIPSQVNPGCAQFLRTEQATILQHGYAHENHGNEHQKFEFGDRPYEEQKEAMAQGMQLMETYFGERFAKVFVPPYHGFSADTLKAAAELDFAGFSAGMHDYAPGALLDLPAQISLTDYPSGSIQSLHMLLKQFVAWRKRTHLIGIYLHHKDIDEPGWAITEQFFTVLCKLQQKGEVEFVSVEQLLHHATKENN